MATATAALSPRGARAWGTHAVRLALCLVVACLLGFSTLLLTGHRVLVVLSGSMSPAIETGDAVVSRVVRPTEVEIGDVVTFKDPERDGRLITHRVKKVVVEGQFVLFVTKGDANDTVERWGIERNGSLGRTWFNVPNAGWALGSLARPLVLAIVAIMSLAMITVLGLKRIWQD